MPSLTLKTIGGRPYYYLRECAWVNGKPKIVWTHYIGSPRTLVQRLLSPSPEGVDLHEFGASAATYDIALALDVVSIIDRYVPKRGSQGPTVGQYMLLAALNRCVAPRSKAQLADWYQKTVLRRLLGIAPSQLTSQRFWDNMDRIEESHLQTLEQEISRVAVSRFNLDLRCLLFDATNFYTFIDTFNERAHLPQRGHSKEGRDNLRIVGLALLVTSDGQVPLLQSTYPGNQTDSVTFASVAKELADRCRLLNEQACDITLVFDKGNNSEDNLDVVAQGPFHFVGSLVPTHHHDLLSIPRTQMRRLDATRFPDVRSYRTEKVVFGVKRTVLCTFNHKLFDAQRKTLLREIGKRKRKLLQLQNSLRRYARTPRGKRPTVETVTKRVDAILNTRHVKDLFRVRVRSSRRGLPFLTFQFLPESWSRLQRTLLGKTILFTDRDAWTDEQIVHAYRSQHHVETAFRRMKDPHFLTFRPTFHWTDQKLRVHAFYCVLALTILSLLRRKLAQKGLSMSMREMMAKLSDIREVAILYPEHPETKKLVVRTMLSRLDTQQQEMVDTLDLQRYQAR